MSSEVRLEDTGQLEFTAVAAWTPYIVLGTIFGVPALTSIAVITVRPELLASWSPPLLVGVLSVTACFVWLRAFLVRIAGGKITYRTLFGSAHVKLDDVRAANHVLEFNPWSNWLKPRNRLDIYIGAESEPRVSINLKVLRRRDVLFLLDLFELSKRKSNRKTSTGNARRE